MFLHLELKVFLWDSPSFASARAPGVLVDQDSRVPSALCVCAFDQGTDASPPPIPLCFLLVSWFPSY